jgi:aspartyl-tRNA(Asn)/glutamyl-tRNA(Gln) amidotransferase subunit C
VRGYGAPDLLGFPPMSDPKISVEEVRHVARLARLRVTDDEALELASQLSHVLGHMDELNALDVADVPPTSHAIPLDAPLREDEVREGLSHEEALAGAPLEIAGGFAVPKVLGGEG